MRRILLRLGISGALAAGLLVGGSPVGVTPTPANAATSACYSAPSNSTCNGQLARWGDDSRHPDCLDSARSVSAASYIDNNTAWHFDIDLMYSDHCGTNWTWARAWNNKYASKTIFRAKVRRLSTTLNGSPGPDGLYKLEYSSAIALSGSNPYVYREISSRMVYSPNNAAQGCLGISRDPDYEDFSGSADQVKCTGTA